MSSLGGTIFDVRVQGPMCVQGKLLSPRDPLCGTRLFVCAKKRVLRAQQIPKRAQRTLGRVAKPYLIIACFKN